MSYIEKSQDVRDFLEEVKDELNEAIKILSKANEDDALDVCEEVQSMLYDLKNQI